MKQAIGTVRPDFGGLTPQQIEVWDSIHRARRANWLLHGVNLGIPEDLYLASGGFPEFAEHEDIDLAGHVARLGVPPRRHTHEQ